MYTLSLHDALPILNVKQSIIINIDKCHPCRPVLRQPLFKSPFGDILEFELSLIQIQPVLTRIRGKVEIWKPIACKITRCYTRTVIKIEVVENIKFRGWNNFIIKIDSRL